MGDKNKQADWLGHPVVDKSHLHALEQRAALLEWHHGYPRAEAEQRALGEYQEEQYAKAAAHHFSGMKGAYAAGNMEAAKQHHDAYANHMKKLGLEPNGALPPKISVHLSAPDHKVYDFAPHGADQFIVSPKGEKKEESLSKGNVVDLNAFRHKKAGTPPNPTCPNCDSDDMSGDGKLCYNCDYNESVHGEPADRGRLIDEAQHDKARRPANQPTLPASPDLVFDHDKMVGQYKTMKPLHRAQYHDNFVAGARQTGQLGESDKLRYRALLQAMKESGDPVPVNGGLRL